MTVSFLEQDKINFGDLPGEIDALLQQGVAAYRHDPRRADELFRQALAAAPTLLPIYLCLYKIHAYQGNLDNAQSFAECAVREAADQAGWDPDWRKWRPQPPPLEGAARFALYTLKALALIHLKKNDQRRARQLLRALRRLDPAGAIGWPVVAALADGIDGCDAQGTAPAPRITRRQRKT